MAIGCWGPRRRVLPHIHASGQIERCMKNIIGAGESRDGSEWTPWPVDRNSNHGDWLEPSVFSDISYIYNENSLPKALIDTNSFSSSVSSRFPSGLTPQPRSVCHSTIAWTIMG